MGTVTIHSQTTKNPISLIGECAGVCWGADTSDSDKNYKRGIDCITSDHGRTLEFPDVYAIIDGYSARVIREWYTHIEGAPTRLQSSTRYINYNNFTYVIPPSIKNNPYAYALYIETMESVKEAMNTLENQFNIPREDAANVLPLGMTTRIMDKRNSRNLVDMSHQRLCTRAYHEFRQLFKDYLDALSKYSPEWKTFIEMTMKPKCKVIGYCPEKKSCGIMPKEEK